MRVSAMLVGVAMASLVCVGTVTTAEAQTRRTTTAADQQQTLTTADIQRLQDAVYDVGGDIARLRSQDSRMADQRQGELDNLRDEVIYLKVKLRKEGNIPRSEYWDLRDRIDTLKSQVRENLSVFGATGARTNEPAWNTPQAERQTGGQQTQRQGEVRQPQTSNPNEVAAGTELDVKLQNALSSSTAQVEDRFEATTVSDLYNGGRVLIPAGSTVRGVVTSVHKAGRIERQGSLTLSFDQVTIRGRSYPIHATVTQALESEGVRGEVGKIGTGGVVGGVIGGILGGVKGALAGILIGAGGTVAATTGKDVDLAPGTLLRVTFDAPLVIR